jgi:hypothetical protein
MRIESLVNFAGNDQLAITMSIEFPEIMQISTIGAQKVRDILIIEKTLLANQQTRRSPSRFFSEALNLNL